MVSQITAIEYTEKFYKIYSGLESCTITDYGYAIEYDCVDSSELKKTLKQK